MTNNCISLKDIDFSYDKHKVYEHFSLDIDRNDIFFIMGVNGCGKTTLLKIICSFLKVDKGIVEVEDKNIEQYESKAFSKVIAYVPQTIHLNSDLLVKDYLAMGRTPYKNFYAGIDDQDYKIVERYAVELGIESILDVDFNTLSGGQKQNVAICRALVQETPIIIMDEPMSALDLGKQAEFLSLILKLKREDKTIILTSHNPNHALALEGESKVCLIDDGKILGLGNPVKVLNESNIHKLFGNEIKLNQDNHTVGFDIKG